MSIKAGGLLVVVSPSCPRTTSSKCTPSAANYSSSSSSSLLSSHTRTSLPRSASFDSPFYSLSVFTPLFVPTSSTRRSWIRSLVGPLLLSPPTWLVAIRSRTPPPRTCVALPPLKSDLAVNRTPPGAWVRRFPTFNPRSAFRAEHSLGPRFPAITRQVPRYITTFLPYHSGAKPVFDQPLLAHPSNEEQDTSMVGLTGLGLLLESLSYLVLGFPKRQKISAEACKLSSPSTGPRKKWRGKSGKSSPENLEARVKIHLPRRALSIRSTPVSDTKTPTSISPSPTGRELLVQVAQHSTTSPTSPSSSAGATPTQRKPLSLVTDVTVNGQRSRLSSPISSANVIPLAVIGRKRPTPAEFDEEVSMPPRKKYITGWMSEYIRLRAPSWRKMLRVMQEARWRPFRPQVIPYLAPAPPSAPLTASRYGCVDPVTGDLPVETPGCESFCSFHNYFFGF